MLTSLPSASNNLILSLINRECLREFPENNSFNDDLMAEAKEMHVFPVSYTNCIRAKFLSFLSVTFFLYCPTYSASTLFLLRVYRCPNMANQPLTFPKM